MKKVAKRHDLECLLHEKPFAGVNGSGKHNNWSMVTDEGENLLNPGKRPHENMQFLLFLVAVLKAVDDHAELLRFSAANPGNDHRLGAAEAPPAIISVFLGEQLEDILWQLANRGEATSSIQGGRINTGVHTLPALKKDVADRNRTSPFAFTGNKFEFRMVASSMSIADANTVLNTIVADTLCQFANELENATDFELSTKELIVRTIKNHSRIVFNGDGYAQAWVEEAARRGLPNLVSMVDAIPAIESEKTIRVFERHNVLNETELRARAEISYEAYSKAVHIEAKTMLDMVSKKYIPAVIRFSTEVANSINAVRAAFPEAELSVQTELLKKVSTLLLEVQTANKTLAERVAEAATKAEGQEKAVYFYTEICPAMKALRKPVDELEGIVDKNMWPVPTYGDLLFEV